MEVTLIAAEMPKLEDVVLAEANSLPIVALTDREGIVCLSQPIALLTLVARVTPQLETICFASMRVTETERLRAEVLSLSKVRTRLTAGARDKATAVQTRYGPSCPTEIRISTAAFSPDAIVLAYPATLKMRT